MLRSPTMAGVSLRDRRRSLLDTACLRGLAFCRAYAAEADAWLADLAERAAGGSARHLALLAVGGYGRAELYPFSDLDVVLLHDGRHDVSSIADAIWYPVWDEGVSLDHSVRRPPEVAEAAHDDVRVALGFLDARLIWGDARIAAPVIEDVASAWRGAEGAAWLGALEAQNHERHQLHGDVAFLLEPELKEGHGGLRDASLLRAVAHGVPRLAQQIDRSTLAHPEEVLAAVRVELHRAAGRSLDRLLLQDQDHVAEVLGYSDADLLMADVSAAGRTIAWVSDEAWRRRARWQPSGRRTLFGRRGRPSPEAPRTIEPGIETGDGEVALSPDAPVARDPALAFRLAAVAAEQDLPIATESLARLGAEAPPSPDPWSPEMRAAFLRTLTAGRPAISALESLEHQGLLSRYLPEWTTVRNLPQRNAYHRFTVDRHLLETAANASTLAERVDRPDLLVLGGLLHDIGKGAPGDHTEAGIGLVAQVARRMGVDPADVETLQAMVRHHLLLPDTATRRDLDDPATIEKVAAAAHDVATLDLLSALTEADSLATGPAAWGGWKAGLVRELSARTASTLRGDASAGGTWVTGDDLALVEQVKDTGRLDVVLAPPRIAVAAPDRPGLLASAAGVLALHGLDVRGANATSDGGVALEVFAVESSHDRWPAEARLRQDLESVLGGTLVVEERLAEKERAYAAGRRPTTPRRTATRVTLDDDASHTATVVEVFTADQIGLLHRVTKALFDCGLDVVSARVATLGAEVVDAFYVQAGGGKVHEAASRARVIDAVRAATN